MPKIVLTDVMSTMIFYMTDVNVICFTSLGVVGRCYCQGCGGNLYGYNICHSSPTYMTITSAMAITSANSGYSICHFTFYQLSHMWFSIIHMVKKSAYYNRTITSVLMAITSASICDFHLSHHNQLPLN